MTTRTCKVCDRLIATDAETDVYCCHGCQAVDRIITSMKLDGDEREAKRRQLLEVIFSGEADDPKPKTGSTEYQQDLRLMIGGMVCPACSWVVHHSLEKLPGVSSASVNFISETASVTFDPMAVGRDRIEQTIESLGYRVREDGAPASQIDHYRFGTGWFFAINVMMLSFVVYSAETWHIPPIMQQACWILMAVFTLMTAFIGAGATLKKGVMQVRKLDFRMETLILVSSTTALAYSGYSIVTGQFSKLYFDVVCLLLMLVETGNVITSSFYAKVRRRVFEMADHLPKKVRLAGDEEVYKSTDELEAGECFTVARDEVVPTDGVLLGEGEFDFSLVNGESAGVELQTGQYVGAGAKLLSDEATLRIPDSGTQSLIGNVIASTIQAFDTNAETQSTGDRISRWFVPVVATIAVAGLLIHALSGDWSAGLITFMSVLIVACPCAFGIAEPLVLTLAVDKAKALGIQIFNGNAFRSKPTMVVFDKTGTLTANDMSIRKVHWLVDENQTDLDVLASLESGIEHPIAKALCALGKGLPLEGREVAVGRISGTFDGTRYQCGKPTIFSSLTLPDEVADEDATLVAFGDADGCRLIVSLGDSMREEVPSVVGALREFGIEMRICSGDREQAVKRVADSLGMAFSSNVTPQDKQDLVRELQADGHCVMMVGDGINDAQSLACADVGIAVFSGQFPAQMSADAVFLTPSIAALPAVVGAMKSIRSRIVANYSWAFAYNAVGISLALFGKLTPTFCAIGMVFSNFVVIINSIRGGADQREDDE